MNFIQTCDSYRQLEETIRGFYFPRITRACSLRVVHFIMDYCQNLCRPHYGKSTVLIVILTVSLLVVHMLNIFCLVSRVGLSAYWVGVSKSFVFFTRRTPSEFVTRSLQNVFGKLLVSNHTQLGQRNWGTTRYATHVVNVR